MQTCHDQTLLANSRFYLGFLYSAKGQCHVSINSEDFTKVKLFTKAIDIYSKLIDNREYEYMSLYTKKPALQIQFELAKCHLFRGLSFINSKEEKKAAKDLKTAKKYFEIVKVESGDQKLTDDCSKQIKRIRSIFRRELRHD